MDDRRRVSVFGVDLAWGERNPDGWCEIVVDEAQVLAKTSGLWHGDEPLLKRLTERSGPLLVAVDAPLICPNLEGSRPVDRLTHRLFGRFKCGCYPANLTKCPRPARVGEKLAQAGIAVTAQWGAHSRIAFEVYPHPAIVRWFGLRERIPYKKGRVEQRREEFARLQRLLRTCLKFRFPEVELASEIDQLLSMPWSKPTEDRTDAFFCALIGYWHWHHGGLLSQVLGDTETGLLVVPTLPSDDPDPRSLEQALLDLAMRRGPKKSFCPSEVARSATTDWRRMMPLVRMVASELCRTGKLVCTQNRVPIEPLESRGPVRLSLA